MMGRHRNLGGNVADLLCKLASGSHDEHERTLPVFGMLEPVHRWKRECCRLACARLRCRDDIAAFQHKRNSLFLHRCRLVVTHAFHCGKGFLRQPKICKFCHSYFSLNKNAVLGTA